ncbi:hypothetical protein Ddye_019278 [Dipteronia dyeriana]|uniref:Splicing factor Cactin n=1 Tax=Dipteronia dyeriana TaxID=168575 RepID=A0AAD9TY45_9ROSI|nr:hypothetical protein Ddye_019278 [Dipteronia dyeriana]
MQIMGIDTKSSKSNRRRGRSTCRHSKKKVTEEEIVEYLAKKAERVAKKSKTKGSGYSNDSNPFGDSNLNERFVWRKKIEQDFTQGVDMFSIKTQKKRQRERMAEFEKIKKARVKRALEKTRREEELAVLARERARVDFQDWEKKDLDFEFNQSKRRSEIRLREGRIKPIDVLCNYLNGQINEEEPPYTIFKDLTVKEMEQLNDDIKMYMDFDRGTPIHMNYWEALKVVCDWELDDRARVLRGGQEMGLHSSIEEDVMRLLQGKTYSELGALETQIESNMRAGTANVVEFWEVILNKHLHIYKENACLKEIHAKLMLQHLQCRIEQPDTTQEAEEEEEGEKEASESFSPQLLHGDENEEEAIDTREDMVLLEEQQTQASLEDMGALNLDNYRPRKPKYFNQVHTGYEWNKYNQTHFDHDNPPPKFVQGYKFNIFYPDLVDKTKALTYTIGKDNGSNGGQTCIIRFHAGIPYENIAFRIVDKEWERSRKKGFKCTFEGGRLQLHFNFKRYPYRR